MTLSATESGKLELIKSVVRKFHTLRLFTNDLISTSITLEDPVLNEITSEQDSKYNPVELVMDNWFFNVSQEELKAEYPVVIFEFSQGIGAVTGYFYTDENDTIIAYEEFIDGPYFMSRKGDRIRIVPSYSLNLTG